MISATKSESHIAKKCTKCGEIGGMDGCGFHKAGNGFFKCDCKRCCLDYAKSYREKNREILRKKTKEYVDSLCSDKKQQRLINLREYRIINRKKLSEMNRQDSNKLTDRYIKTILSKSKDIRFNQITNEIIELKRQELINHRIRQSYKEELKCLKSQAN